jgi:hypothetical protein
MIMIVDLHMSIMAQKRLSTGFGEEKIVAKICTGLLSAVSG